jgi:serine/threonine transporter
VFIIKKYNETSLVLRIIIGLILGIACALLFPQATMLTTLGNLFVGALRAIAPLLVFFLVASALLAGNSHLDRRFTSVIFFYLFSTLIAAVIAVFASTLFPQKIVLASAYQASKAPSGIKEIVNSLLMNLVDNPVNALVKANYIGILFWAILTGFALKAVAKKETITIMNDIASGLTKMVQWIINLAPFGVMGLVYTSVSQNGLGIFSKYGSLLLLLMGSMIFVALVVNPLIVGIALKRNPYPLVFRCLKESGITAFFTRSSAANIPVNMALCERLGLDRDVYAISIPLGATINMNGAAITITVMTLATANTLGIHLNIVTAIALSVLAALAACGSSGVTGGSLLLIPLACSLFGIPNAIAMQVVGVGVILGVIQDSMETALNSSGDVLFAATAEYRDRLKAGKPLPAFLNQSFFSHKTYKEEA